MTSGASRASGWTADLRGHDRSGAGCSCHASADCDHPLGLGGCLWTERVVRGAAVRTRPRTSGTVPAELVTSILRHQDQAVVTDSEEEQA
jgi:hypothetical protein